MKRPNDNAASARRQSTDDVLRSRQWRIWSRPKTGPVLWRRRGATLPQDKALASAYKEINDEAQSQAS